MQKPYVLATALALAAFATRGFGAGLFPDDPAKPEPQPKPASAPVETKVKDLGVVPGGVVSFANPAALLVASPDGTRLAWTSNDPKTRKWRVFEAGRPGPPFDEVDVETLAFTPDGRRLAYVARLGPDRHVLIGDKIIRGALAYAFSPDGKRFAWVTCDANENYDLWLNDAKVSRRSHPITHLTFSPDSRRFAYVFRNSQAEGRWIWLRPQLMVDGKVGRAVHEDIRDLTFSPDSRHWAAVVKDDKRWRVLLDDKDLPAFEDVGAPAFAPAGLHLAYPARVGPDWRMVRDSKAGPAYANVDLPVFSRDGAHLAYFAKGARAPTVVCDDREAGDYTTVEWIAFSPDSRHLAWVATRAGNTFMVVDGVELAPHAQIVVPTLACDVPGKLRYVVVEAEVYADPAKPLAEESTRAASLVEVDWPAEGTWEDAFKTPAAAAK